MSDSNMNNTEIQEYLMSLVGNTPFGIITLDLLGKIAIINESLIAYLNLKDAIYTYTDRPILDVIKGIPAFEKNMRKCLLEGRRPFDIDEIKYQDRYLAIKGRVILNGMLITVEDITYVKKAEHALVKRAEELQAKNSELEQFVYIASHYLQEPLRTVMNFTELIEDEYSNKLDDLGLKSLNYILQAASRMSNLIKGLLDYSRIGQDKILETIDCNLLLKEVLDNLNASIKETKAEIVIGEMPKLKGYRFELLSLFQNLITNSITYQNGTDVPKIIVKSEPKDRHSWEFSITDNGIGIPEKHLKKIFTIYKRLHGQEVIAGTGIGLSHCKKIIELHQGRIWAESKKEKGSTFYFTISKLKQNE